MEPRVFTWDLFRRRRCAQEGGGGCQVPAEEPGRMHGWCFQISVDLVVIFGTKQKEKKTENPAQVSFPVSRRP